MLLTDYLTKELGKNITNINISYNLTEIPEGILILNENVPEIKNHIYISDFTNMIKAISSRSVAPPATFFIAADEHAPDRNIKPPAGYNIIKTSLDTATLYNELYRALYKVNESEMYIEHIGFAGFLYDIMSMKLQTHGEIKDRINTLRYPLSKFRYHIVIIKFADLLAATGKSDSLFKELEQIFPECNMTFFEKKIVLLFPDDNRINRFPIEVKDKLYAFLKENDGVAAISNGVKKPEIMRTIYFLTDNILKIGRTLKDNHETRIFDQEYFGLYNVVDFCSKQFEQLFHHNDILYLTHPGIIALSRYDEDHGTNLLDVLHCYLMNNKNLAQTSKQLYMHRNTILNKIHKIIEITDVDFNDEQTQFQLMFSFLIVNYQRGYKNQDKI